MKKLLILAVAATLAACQSPYEHNVYNYTGPRTCVEYQDAFVCSAPTQVWHETVYPKNNAQMIYGEPEYRQTSLSRSVYGTY